MDEADRAAPEIAQLLAEQLRNAHRPVPRLKPAGYCHHCGEDTTPVQLFCGADCAAVFRE